jgi:5-oxoprolinase (ATP-hydrolysing)
MGVAEQGGAVLQRVARSVNVRERLDFSCAVFDEHGQLVANAPHIPVHLGAMGVTVRDLITRVDPPVGTHWLCNDPAAGGSHLPDLTVTTAVDLGGARVFVACRAHHVDVGGSTPGSMPPRSRSLAEEGLVFRQVPVGADGSGPDLAGSRQPAVVRADLAAQVAANLAMAERLRQLGPPDVVRAWSAHLLDATEELVTALIDTLPARSGPVTDVIDGVPLCLTLRRESSLVVDFTGTGGPHAGNLNAPPAVVRAAVLYALRVLVDGDIPLNEGALRPVRLVVPSPSLLDPPVGAAIAGGNVETSMRIADLMLRAVGRYAASAGTMNNFTIGGEGWAAYETLGGGQGAGPRGAGASARQLHMTNTRATDAEVLEHRLPLRVRRFNCRPGSGGRGLHPGGDGLIREIEVLAPATACLLATRRSQGAAGLGGEPGLPGRDAVIRDGREEPWDGDPIELLPGDRVRVQTPGGGGFRPA